jgi:hypothetical protein
MKISGFSFVRNGIKLYYPVVEAIKSILPIVDEFIIAVGAGDEDDKTRELIAGINDKKVKIIDTEWKPEYFKGGIINSIQTDIAKNACTGDWLFYLQADEVVHEKYLTVIKNRCEELLDNKEVEGLVFRYKHFWGDYKHYHNGHGWYPNEIRIIRNKPEIHSWQSAQSFRKFDYYDNPRQPEGHHKIKVARVDAEIYHYGWVRPPYLMQNKKRALDSVHWGLTKASDYYDNAPKEFDYGPLNLLAEFNDTHPKVMKNMIEQMNWHEKIIYRILSFIENNFYGKKRFGEFKNYILLKDI